MKKVAVIGAGASGLMAAYAAANRGKFGAANKFRMGNLWSFALDKGT